MEERTFHGGTVVSFAPLPDPAATGTGGLSLREAGWEETTGLLYLASCQKGAGIDGRAAAYLKAGRPSIVAMCAPLLASGVVATLRRWDAKPTCIAPVVSNGRETVDPSGVPRAFADAIAAAGVGTVRELVCRRPGVKPLKGVRGVARAARLRGASFVSDEMRALLRSLNGYRLLVVDDDFYTGATLNDALRALREAAADLGIVVEIKGLALFRYTSSSHDTCTTDELHPSVRAARERSVQGFFGATGQQTPARARSRESIERKSDP
jgi:hypothetical protein